MRIDREGERHAHINIELVTVDDSKTKLHKSQPKPGEETGGMNESGFTYNPESSKDHQASMLSIHYLSKGKSPQI